MKREKALYDFWASFGLPLYDETSVPDGVKLPYMVYETATGAFDINVPLTVSLYYYSSSWVEITEKAREIIDTIGIGKRIKYDGGGMIITIPNQDYTRMGDNASDMVRRIIINVSVEFVN